MKKSFGIRARLTAAVLVALLLVAVLCPTAFASFSAKINNSSATVYQYPSTACPNKYSGLSGLKVTVTDWQSGWAQITYRGYTGYTQIYNLDLTNPITGWTSCATKVYSAPYQVAGTAPAGTKVYVIGYYNGYCRVRSTSGSSIGYIAASDLTRSEPTSSSSSASSSSYTPGAYSGNAQIDYVLYIAYQNLGAPYSSSANPPSSFDCSAFVRYCYGCAGVYVGRTACDQGYNDSFTKITSISDLRIGDMICFNTDESDDDLSDHTAIYVGSGYFVHASSNAGKVQVNYFTDYYKEHFSWARRVIG